MVDFNKFAFNSKAEDIYYLMKKYKEHPYFQSIDVSKIKNNNWEEIAINYIKNKYPFIINNKYTKIYTNILYNIHSRENIENIGIIPLEDRIEELEQYLKNYSPIWDEIFIKQSTVNNKLKLYPIDVAIGFIESDEKIFTYRIECRIPLYFRKNINITEIDLFQNYFIANKKNNSNITKKYKIKKITDKKIDYKAITRIYALHPIFMEYFKNKYKDNPNNIPIIDGSKYIMNGTHKLYQWFTSSDQSTIEIYFLDKIQIFKDLSKIFYDNDLDDIIEDYALSPYDHVFYAEHTECNKIIEFHIPIIDNIEQYIQYVNEEYLDSHFINSISNIVKIKSIIYTGDNDPGLIFDKYSTILNFNNLNTIHCLKKSENIFENDTQEANKIKNCDNIYNILLNIDNDLILKDHNIEYSFKKFNINMIKK